MITPNGYYILVKPSTDETTSSGLSYSTEERPQKGEIVAFGEGKTPTEGLKVGSQIFFKRYGIEKIEYEGQEYFLLLDADILAIIQ
ncbi:MAG: co-chaperone GroES family protein [Candidatus Pacearchaeota archaeon]